MKNLFSINKTQDPEATEFDQNPYVSRRVSEKVRQGMKDAFAFMAEDSTPKEPSQEEKALRKTESRYWLLCLVCLVGAVVLFLVGSRTGLYRDMAYLHILDLSLLVTAILCNFKARRINRQQGRLRSESTKTDLSEASRRLEAATAEAARELGVPANALSIDVFPYHYKQKGDTLLRVGKPGRYDNLSTSVFLQKEALCFATAQELFAIPLSELRGFREYDEDFETDMWLKPQDSDSDRYKEFHIRKIGFFGRKGHGYFGLQIGTEYEVLIPCYDWPLVKELLERHGVS